MHDVGEREEQNKNLEKRRKNIVERKRRKEKYHSRKEILLGRDRNLKSGDTI